jgi:hypothetical protein
VIDDLTHPHSGAKVKKNAARKVADDIYENKK